MVDPKLGTKRVCESCGAKFYDLNKQPVTCPKCSHSFDPMAAFVKNEPVRELKPSAKADDEDEDDGLEDEADQISLDEVDDGIDDSDDEAQALAEFDDDDALLEDEEDDEEDSFLEDEDDDD